MELVISLIASLALALLLRKPIKKYPIVFYVIAVAVDVLFLTNVLFDVQRDVAIAGYPYVVRCLVGFSLFTIVMYVGALGDKNRVRHMLMPIRGELSVIACILTFGHVINYLNSYIEDILGGFFGMPVSMVASLVVSAILIILLVPLAVTSLNSVKSRMNKASWKTLQKAAYVFYVLTFIHILLMLIPTFSTSAQRATVSMVIYGVILVVYVALRTRKAMIDKQHDAQQAQTETN